MIDKNYSRYPMNKIMTEQPLAHLEQMDSVQDQVNNLTRLPIFTLY